MRPQDLHKKRAWGFLSMIAAGLNTSWAELRLGVTKWYYGRVLKRDVHSKAPWIAPIDQERKNAKGREAEIAIAAIIQLFLDKNYEVYHDIEFRYVKEDAHTQIDILAISPFGIFVIEVKNIEGEVSDTESWHGHWKINNHGKIRYPVNPTRQNARQIHILSKILNVKENKLVPLVIWAGDKTSFKNGIPEGVITEALVSFVKKHKRIVFTPYDMEYIKRQIAKSRNYL